MRDEHGLHAGREPHQGETRGSVVNSLNVFVARNTAALEKVGPGKNKLGDLTPVGLPNAVFGKQPRMAAEKIIGGDS